jgi:2-oxoglutarate ferredoxin oxidoreductase subunit beta
MSTVIKPTSLTKKDFATDQEVRWCPGCGDYAILAATQSVLPTLDRPKEQFVIVSGIGCASRFPYYMNVYGFHTVHGRAPTIATGIKVTNPDLSVWIVSGDGDALSIGGNHLIHLMRRNVDVNMLLFDNRIYGLTKGQYSPTSERGKKTKSTPYGSIDRPFNPITLALGAGASFIARSVDVFTPHLKQVLTEAEAHRGTSFVQIYQNCNIFNDGAFDSFREKAQRPDNTLLLEHGKPLIFGKDNDRGIRIGEGYRPEAVRLGNGIKEEDLLVHDEQGSLGYLAMLSELESLPDFPVPIGIFRRAEAPTFDAETRAQIDEITERKGKGDLAQALCSGNTWVIE